jgi:aryl-alcohol dehydrogenase-like predicted oxidoreductase
MGLRAWPVDWSDAALRFTAHLPGVHSCIVGTRNLEHLERNAEIVRRGPLDAQLAEKLRAAFSSRGATWRSET